MKTKTLILKAVATAAIVSCNVASAQTVTINGVDPTKYASSVASTSAAAAGATLNSVNSVFFGMGRAFDYSGVNQTGSGAGTSAEVVRTATELQNQAQFRSTIQNGVPVYANNPSPSSLNQYINEYKGSLENYAHSAALLGGAGVNRLNTSIDGVYRPVYSIKGNSYGYNVFAGDTMVAVNNRLTNALILKDNAATVKALNDVNDSGKMIIAAANEINTLINRVNVDIKNLDTIQLPDDKLPSHNFLMIREQWSGFARDGVTGQ